MTYTGRLLFEAMANQAAGKCRYVFLVDNPTYAEALHSDEYMAVMITPTPASGAYTLDEFDAFINDAGKAIYARDYMYLPICSKTRNEALREALDMRALNQDHDAWKAFTKGAGYYQQHPDELKTAAQGAIGRYEDREQDGRDWVDNPGQRLTGASPLFNELVPFDNTEQLPAFPVHEMPPTIRDYITALADTVQASVCLTGACVLGALSIACRGRYPIKEISGHIERPCLYLMPIAGPSERKSGVINAAMRPLNEYEKQYNIDHAGEVAQSKSELRQLQGRIAHEETQAIKTKDSAARMAAEGELEALNNRLAEFVPIEPLRLHGADVTPEKLAAMIQAQGEVFALVSAEGGGIMENMGRYSEKGGMELYLHGYSGDSVRIDRKNSESVALEHPTLNILAPVQPDVVRDMFSDRQKAGRGLLTRFFFVDCPPLSGGRVRNTAPVPEKVANSYDALCKTMLSAESAGVLELSHEADAAYGQFFDDIERKIHREHGELYHMADWVGKLRGGTLRLAGLIHCVRGFEHGVCPTVAKISGGEMVAAISLGYYFLAHAKAVYGEQAEPKGVSDARYLWGRIKSLKSLQKRDAIRKTQNKQGFNLDESLNELAKRGYIRIEKSQTAGRPSKVIHTNPTIDEL